MPIYIAVPLSPDNSDLDKAVTELVPSENRYKLQANAGWLIKFEGTTIELSHHIGVTSPDKNHKPAIGSTILVPVSSYYGRGPTDMWEWLKTRLEQ